MNPDTPVIFTDGTKFFNELGKTYVKHNKGRFILAPSGSGKSYFINNQKINHWIDGDYLWPATNADLSGDSWETDFDLVAEVNNRSDVITHQANKIGFWVIGSSNNTLRPDAIVLLPWKLHKNYIMKRESIKYDGGAKTEDFVGVINHRREIKKWASKGVPVFRSVEEAANFIQSRND